MGTRRRHRRNRGGDPLAFKGMQNKLRQELNELNANKVLERQKAAREAELAALRGPPKVSEESAERQREKTNRDLQEDKENKLTKCQKRLSDVGITGDTTAELNKSFRKVALKYHPDKNPGNPDAVKIFQELQECLNRRLAQLQEGGRRTRRRKSRRRR
jgi:hypothetical protein